MTDTATTTGAQAADDVDEATNKMAIGALIPLLITFILGTLCLQGFDLVFQQVGVAVGAPEHASLITALPSIVLGIVCFIYGSLGDFVSLRKMVTVGLVTLLVGSLFGFIANYFFQANLWTVITARVLQTAGEQVAGSAYLVVATKYLRNSLKVIFFGLFTAGYQLSAAIGVFAAGLLSSLSWQFLFLIPSVTILFLPLLLKNLPAKNGNGKKVDIFGFTIFGLGTAFLTLFFSYMNWWLLLVSVVLFVGFGLYIDRAKSPFVTPAFFRNVRWIMAISLIALFYFVNYCISPFFNAIGHDVYGMSTIQVSDYVVWAFVVATAVGTSSGVIVGKIGRQHAIITAGCLMTLGFVGSALLVKSGFLVLTLMACVFYAGVGLMYSPLISTVLGTLPKSESGRGVGMNDLIMNVTGSIGIAIFGGLMGAKAMSGSSLVGATGAAASYSNLLLVGGGVLALGVVAYLVFRKKIYSDAA
ncbi:MULTISPECIES: MFS transporter [Bifidobacterium]|uniref:MFS transporter n=1 Tax=Bifidobacterium tibiigranuli TaxID=2172043 RepID=A0A5N6S4K6_9BIFI|nr:MFS transporter [Bifidobacterium tibiigranuli]KAE8128434.1 MFS transporter [Bifidobacterium tibiigranuli]KAE8128550.1 MFS transporter [Bifidobacterium tibiigranuli]